MRHGLFAGFVLTCLACLIWPIYGEIGARIEPYVLGLPLSLAWVVGWVLATFAALVAYHVTGPSDEANDVDGADDVDDVDGANDVDAHDTRDATSDLERS